MDTQPPKPRHRWLGPGFIIFFLVFYFISYHKYKYILSIFISKEPCNPPLGQRPKTEPLARRTWWRKME